MPSALQSLLDAVEPIGVYPDLKASLNLKVDIASRDKPVNLGYITKNGQLWTQQASWNVREDIWRPYLNELATMVDGVVAKDANTYYVAVNGRSAPRIEQFLPDHQHAVVAAIEGMVRRLNSENG